MCGNLGHLANLIPQGFRQLRAHLVEARRQPKTPSIQSSLAVDRLLGSRSAAGRSFAPSCRCALAARLSRSARWLISRRNWAMTWAAACGTSEAVCSKRFMGASSEAPNCARWPATASLQSIQTGYGGLATRGLLVTQGGQFRAPHRRQLGHAPAFATAPRPIRPPCARSIDSTGPSRGRVRPRSGPCAACSVIWPAVFSSCRHKACCCAMVSVPTRCHSPTKEADISCKVWVQACWRCPSLSNCASRAAWLLS